MRVVGVVLVGRIAVAADGTCGRRELVECSSIPTVESKEPDVSIISTGSGSNSALFRAAPHFISGPVSP